MDLRTYHARTMADALGEVKRDLGRDAVILHTRTYRVGGFFGFGARPMVEITASRTVNAPTRSRRSPAPPAATPRATPKPDLVGAAADPGLIGAGRVAGRRLDTVYGRFDEPDSEPGAEVAPPSVPAAADVAKLAVRVPVAPSSRKAAADFEEELGAIKRMVGQVLQATRASAGSAGGVVACGGMPETLFAQYLRLLEHEVAAEIADEIVGRVRDELTPAELSEEVIVRETVLRHLSRLIPAVEPAAPIGRSDDGRPLTIALVGPTGVGKTTTVAKLAAAYKLRHNRRVGLVTSDTFRIAAVDQLRTYANIIGLPLKVALTPSDMVSGLAQLSDCDVVLIDTAGRSQHDGDRLEELARFLEAADPHETHLVLSSTASETVLVRAAERFAVVRPDRLIMTKLDEAVSFGVLVTVAKRVNLALSYVTTGQEVPDHIEAGRPERLARLVLDGELAR